jgi:hypothetical protein
MEYLHGLGGADPQKRGDYWEFGVASGETLIIAYKASKLFPGKSAMKFFGFDSFQGIPEISGKEDAASMWSKGDFTFGIETVLAKLKRYAVDISQVTLVPGFYEQSLNPAAISKYKLKKVSYLRLDCDLYSSTKTVLNFVKPFLTDGAIIDFDDYFCYASNDFGEPLAFQEWLKANPDIRAREFSRYSTFGKTFTISFHPNSDR